MVFKSFQKSPEKTCFNSLWLAAPPPQLPRIVLIGYIDQLTRPINAIIHLFIHLMTNASANTTQVLLLSLWLSDWKRNGHRWSEPWCHRIPKHSLVQEAALSTDSTWRHWETRRLMWKLQRRQRLYPADVRQCLFLTSLSCSSLWLPLRLQRGK